MDYLYVATAASGGMILLWIFIIVLFLSSFLGIIIPVVPGVLLLWLGFLMYHFFIDPEALTLFFWVSMGIFTLLLLGADFYINIYFVDQFGGSKGSKWGAFIGLFIGLFVYPPFGILIVPLLIVFFIELTIHGSFKKSFFASLGTLAGFLSSAIAKVLLQGTMIVIFFIFIIV